MSWIDYRVTFINGDLRRDRCIRPTILPCVPLFQNKVQLSPVLLLCWHADGFNIFRLLHHVWKLLTCQCHRLFGSNWKPILPQGATRIPSGPVLNFARLPRQLLLLCCWSHHKTVISYDHFVSLFDRDCDVRSGCLDTSIEQRVSNCVFYELS